MSLHFFSLFTKYYLIKFAQVQGSWINLVNRLANSRELRTNTWHVLNCHVMMKIYLKNSQLDFAPILPKFQRIFTFETLRRNFHVQKLNPVSYVNLKWKTFRHYFHFPSLHGRNLSDIDRENVTITNRDQSRVQSSWYFNHRFPQIGCGQDLHPIWHLQFNIVSGYTLIPNWKR